LGSPRLNRALLPEHDSPPEGGHYILSLESGHYIFPQKAGTTYLSPEGALHTSRLKAGGHYTRQDAALSYLTSAS